MSPYKVTDYKVTGGLEFVPDETDRKWLYRLALLRGFVHHPALRRAVHTLKKTKEEKALLYAISLTILNPKESEKRKAEEKYLAMKRERGEDLFTALNKEQEELDLAGGRGYTPDESTKRRAFERSCLPGEWNDSVEKASIEHQTYQDDLTYDQIRPYLVRKAEIMWSKKAGSGGVSKESRNPRPQTHQEFGAAAEGRSAGKGKGKGHNKKGKNKREVTPSSSSGKEAAAAAAASGSGFFLRRPAPGRHRSLSPSSRASSEKAVRRGGGFIRATLHNAKRFEDEWIDGEEESKVATPMETFIGAAEGKEYDSIIADSGCSFSLSPPSFEKFSVGKEKRRVNFRIASDVAPLVTEIVHTLHLPVRDRQKRVRLVPDKAAIDPSVSCALLACGKRDLILRSESGKPSWVKLRDVDGHEFLAVLDMSGPVPTLPLYTDEKEIAAAYEKKMGHHSGESVESVFSSFVSAFAGEAKDENTVTPEKKKHLLYVLHSRLAHATGERLFATLKKKGVGLFFSLQECRDVRKECKACRKVNFRRHRLKRRGWKAKKRGKRKEKKEGKASSAVGGASERESDDSSEKSAGSREQGGKKKRKIKFNCIIFHDLKNMKRKAFGGFRYVSVIVDQAFWRVSLMALRKKDHAQRHLLSWTRRWEVAGFGKPLIVRSDNGGEFSGDEEYLRVCSELGVGNDFGPLGTPEVQAFVERVNLSFFSLMNKVLLQARIPFYMWPAILPGVANALNEVVYSSIGRSPNACIYGRPSGIPSVSVGDVVRIIDPSFRSPSAPFEKSERALFRGVMGPRSVSVLLCRAGRWKALRVHPFHIAVEEWLGVGTRDFDADRRGIDRRGEEESPSLGNDLFVGWDLSDDRTDGVLGLDDARSDRVEPEEDIDLPPLQSPPRGVCSAVLKGLLVRDSNGALFPAQLIREGERQMRGASISRLEWREDGSFRPAAFERVAQKDIVERFDLPENRSLPDEILHTLAEDDYPPEDNPQPPAQPDSSLDDAPLEDVLDELFGVDRVMEQVAEEANAAEFVQWSQMTKKQWRQVVRERRRWRRQMTEERVSKSLDAHFEMACAVLKAEKAQKLLQRENEAKGHILVTEEEIEEGLFKEADRKELTRWCASSVFDLSSQTLSPQPGVKGITLRWVRTWKMKGGKRIAKSKLVARGFQDPRDAEILETYSGTADAGLARVAFVWALSRGWEAAKVDVLTAFLQAPIEDGVWLRLPHDLPVEVYPGLRCGVFIKIVKAVYELKDAPKKYTDYFKRKVRQLGWTEVAESILVKRNRKGEPISLCVMHVDDLFVFSPNVDSDVSAMWEIFMMDEPERMDNGELHMYVGMSVRMRPGEMLLDQSVYILNMAESVSEAARKPITDKDLLIPSDKEVDLFLQKEQQKNTGAICPYRRSSRKTQVRWVGLCKHSPIFLFCSLIFPAATPVLPLLLFWQWKKLYSM
uniref:Integrase catalytic domain-containing protein n=1 Tax=Chromera velia CCMP2878 TaxID=1169474 RepID=A0A0G4HNT8_9ALVE|eukprot:Cvel_7703.t1-p1 / transcript=Cvel_7703.t1 / gene=Cvel_7703 / organism=Chromera_velia_CCMP2878 / gene_product=Copia protein, putative / transcript_product=Copia protein, putative / location=Cvel_scaffold409:32458-39861(+) / protein_length=1442 / sequence_SO=supercontig / SO=protein_coding / is_pseudo=false